MKIKFGNINALLPLKGSLIWAKIQKRFDICKWRFSILEVRNLTFEGKNVKYFLK
jgi:hypothetical protein